MTADLTVIILAKRPDPGRVKTRLVTRAGLDEAGAASAAWAMLVCVARRLAARHRVVVALSPDEDPAGWPADAEQELFDRARRRGGGVIAQGPGTLGARLDRVWRQVGACERVAFFGGDSPDVPASALEAIGPALDDADLAIGPTDDGGYWTLAARAYRPEVLADIDWGGASVYDQSRHRAREAGASVAGLPTWYDVDRPVDLEALRERLARRVRRGGSGRGRTDDRLATEDDDALAALADRLATLLR